MDAADGHRYAGITSVNHLWKLLSIGILGLTLAEPSLLWASGPQEVAAPAADAAAMAQFDAAIAKYIAMRRGALTEVPGPVKDSSSTQLTNASDALAGSIQRARRGAQAGAIFSPPVADAIKRRIANAVAAGHLEATLADIDDDGKESVTPAVHLRLPISAQMATMPAGLLKVLPTLPKELEYRIVGRYLILRDVDASLILDYIPGAVPR